MTAIHAIETDGVRLAVRERGAGSPVALLHGFFGCSRDLAPLAASLARHHRVLAIDLVGHGRSDAPRETAAYAMERCVEQVAGALEALDATPAHVFGYSMGGRAALALAVRRPDGIRSLALLGASAGLEHADERDARRAHDETLAAQVERDGVPAFTDAWSRLPLFATQQERVSEYEREAIRDRRLANRAHGLAGSLRGMGTGAQPALHAALPKLPVPVWLGHGADDAKFAAIARDLARRLPRAERCAIPEAGHAAHLENGDAVAREVARFLARVDANENPTRPPDPIRAAQGEAL